MKRTFTIIFAALMIACFAMSCGDKEKKDLIVGKWSLESVMTLDGEIVAGAEEVAEFPNIEFTKDRNFNVLVSSPMNPIFSLGTYSIKGDILKIVIDESLLEYLAIYMEEDSAEMLEALEVVMDSGISIKKLTNTRLQLQPVVPEGIEVEDSEMVLINFKKG